MFKHIIERDISHKINKPISKEIRKWRKRLQQVYVLNKYRNDSGKLYKNCTQQEIYDIYRLKTNISNRKEQLYEEKWNEINQQYAKIEFHLFVADSIGEMITRFLDVINEKEQISDNVLHVFSPWRATRAIEYANLRFLNIISRYICLVDEKSLSFWEYALEKYPGTIGFEHYMKYRWRRNKVPYLMSDFACKVEFTEDEENEAKDKMKMMGINGEYMCIHCRDSSYNNTVLPGYNENIHDYRNSSIDNYTYCSDYLESAGLQTVRMGKYVREPVGKENCVDYATYFHDDLMDIYLSANCKFFVGTASGLTAVPSFFKKPIVVVNLTLIAMGWGSVPYTQSDIYIPKKYWHTNKKRYLNLAEMMEVEEQCQIYGEKFKKLNIEMIENTKEEILDAVIEMNQRLDGVWIETEEEKRLRAKYEKIFINWHKEHPAVKESWIGNGIPVEMKMGAKYLLENQYLLMVEDKYIQG